MMQGSLRGKTALVTGAARRIGRAICLALAEEGADIVVHYRSSESEAHDLVVQLAGCGVEAWPIKADFDCPEEYETLIARAWEVAGSLDILVNSASVFPVSTLDSMTLEDVMQSFRANAWAPFVLSRAFARLCDEGKIINILDARIEGYDWNHAAYILSKHALAQLTRMTALDFAPDITVNAIAPGLILPPPGKGTDYLDRLTATVPLRRHGTPQDVAAAAVYLLKNDFITGQVIYLDGGKHLAREAYGPYPHQ